MVSANAGRYVRIKPGYLLRGWQGLPYALVKRQNGKPAFMSGDVFRTLRFCNGRFTPDSPVFMGARTDHLQKLDELGVLEYLEEPGDLLPDQEYVLFDNRYLRQVHWSLTGHCNYRCRHCYMSAPHAVLPHPTIEKCLSIADQIANCGVMDVSLTGGEPLVRSDFLAIVDRILERGMIVSTIMTNGALVTEHLLDELDARGCHPAFNMSFDGPAHWHDWLRGVQGAHESVCKALALCREKGFTTDAELVLHKGNIDALRESVKTLGELGVRSLKVNRLHLVGEAEAISDYAISTEEEYEAYLEYIPQYLEDGMPVPSIMLSGLFASSHGKLGLACERHAEDEDCSRKVICASARTTMYLGPDGRILPCIPMSELPCVSEQFPTVGELSLSEALSNSFYLDFISKTLDEYLDHNPRCAACTYKNRCGGACRGHAVISNGGTDLLGIDPDTCLIFTGGYYDRVKELIEASHKE